MSSVKEATSRACWSIGKEFKKNIVNQSVLTKEKVNHIAKLSRVLPDEKVHEQLDDMIRSLKSLENVNTEGISPMKNLLEDDIDEIEIDVEKK